MQFIKKIIYFLFCITPFFAVAQQNAKQENELVLVAGLDKPPFIIEKADKGLQLDLIRQAFQSEQIAVNFVHIPLGRNITGFRRLNADGIMTLPAEYQHPAMFMSKSYINYQNVAISLAENQFVIDKISDLSDKSIIAFQNAKKFLGEDYELSVAYSMDYREVADQQQQMELLFLRRAEVIILDINIFKYFLKYKSDGVFTKPFKVHYIFNERPYSIGFKSEKMRDIFDTGIQSMKEDGSYQLILDNYLQ